MYGSFFHRGERELYSLSTVGVKVRVREKVGVYHFASGGCQGGGTPEPDSESALFKKIIKGDFFKHSGFDQISTSESHQLLLIST